MNIVSQFMLKTAMRIMVIITIIALILPGLSAFSEGMSNARCAGTDSRDPAETCRITGYINETGDGSLQNVRVQIEDSDGDHNETGSNETGMFEIWVRPGQTKITVFYHGYRGQNRTIDAQQGHVPNVNFTLAPLGPELVTITGFVNSTLGGPVGDATVYLTDGETWENATKSNDTTGQYRINCVNGTVRMVVVKEGYQWFVKDMNLADHQMVELDVELEPVPEPVSVIKGYVRDESGLAIEDIDVFVINDTHLYQNGTDTDARGYYEIGVISDWLHLIADDDDYFEFHDYFYVAEDRTIWMNITLHEKGAKNARFFGTVIDEDTGDPIPGVEVGVEMRDVHWDAETVTDANGDFELYLYRGDYEGEIHAYGYFGDDFGFNIDEEEEMEKNFELERAPPMNSLIKGFISDEDGDPMDVRAVIAFDFINDSMNMAPTLNGYFELPTWAGNFIVAAMAQGYSISGKAVYVPPDSIVWVNLTMYELTSVVRGYVTDQYGYPIFEAEISLIDDLTISMEGFKTNETGYYEAHTHPGTFAMIVGGEGDDFMESGEFEPYVDEITIQDHTEVWVNVTLYESKSNPMSVEMSFSDWDHLVQQGEAATPRNKTMETRLFLDTILGNGDMTITEDELEAMTRVFKKNVLVDDDDEDNEDDSPFKKYTNDSFLLDGISYVLDEDSADVVFEGYEGAWDAPGTAKMVFYGEYNSTEPIPDSLTHDLRINMSWRYPDEGGEEELSFSFPGKFGAMDWEPVVNMTISGSNPWVIAPGVNPYREYEDHEEDLEEGKDYVWISAFVNRTYNTTDRTPGQADCGANLTFELEFEEWEDVDSLDLLWRHIGESDFEDVVLNGTAGVYAHTLNVPGNESRDIEYGFVAVIDAEYSIRVPHLGYGEVDVNDPILPVAVLSVSPALARVNETVTLNASGSTDNIGIVLYNFTFGDGSFIETVNATVKHVYNASGTYEVTVTVLDAEGNGANVSARARVTNDTCAPAIESTVPADGAVDVDPDTAIEVVFSEDIDQSLLSIECKELDIEFEYDGANRTAVITVNGTLDLGARYVFVIGASDLVGNALSGYNFSFTVIAWEKYDSDGDGVPNGEDAFPDNPMGAVDTDGDGKPDKLLEAAGWNGTTLVEDLDDDGDNWTDADEIRLKTDPLDASSFPPDLDGDGTADEDDPDIDGDGVPNEKDKDPLDASVGESSDDKRSSSTGLIIIIVVILILVGGGIAVAMFVMKRSGKKAPEAPEYEDEFEELPEDESGGPGGAEDMKEEEMGSEESEDDASDVEDMEREMEDFDDDEFGNLDDDELDGLDDDDLPPPDDDW